MRHLLVYNNLMAVKDTHQHSHTSQREDKAWHIWISSGCHRGYCVSVCVHACVCGWQKVVLLRKGGRVVWEKQLEKKSFVKIQVQSRLWCVLNSTCYFFTSVSQWKWKNRKHETANMSTALILFPKYFILTIILLIIEQAAELADFMTVSFGFVCQRWMEI